MLARQEAARRSALLIAHLEQPNIALLVLIGVFLDSNSGEHERSTGPTLIELT